MYVYTAVVLMIVEGCYYVSGCDFEFIIQISFFNTEDQGSLPFFSSLFFLFFSPFFSFLFCFLFCLHTLIKLPPLHFHMNINDVFARVNYFSCAGKAFHFVYTSVISSTENWSASASSRDYLFA